MTTPADSIRSYKIEAEYAIKNALQTFTLQTGVSVTGVEVMTHVALGDKHRKVDSVNIELSI